MKRLLFFLLLIPAAKCFAQTDEQQVKNIVEIFNTGKIDSAIALMDDVVKKDPDAKNWDMLCRMYFERYEYSRSIKTDVIVALIGQQMGADMKTPKYASPNICLNDMINICRKAQLRAESATASQLLRNYLVDADTDKNVPEGAITERDKAETFFKKKDYANAKLQYQKALVIYPAYYSAMLYLGDVFWYQGNMDSAIYCFRQVIKMQPEQLEPRKYLVDALGYIKENAAAKEECFQSIYIYPDQSIFLKYADLAKRESKVFRKQWIGRGCEVNSIRYTQTNTTEPVWTKYQQAKNSIKMYCDSNGIIVKANTLTKAKYLEVYSWENMLAKNTTVPQELAFAKKMADAGFLDCYVFISLFHYDLYEQYKHFAKNNKERIKQYMETYLVQAP